jgi:L-lysine 6-transaminase
MSRITPNNVHAVIGRHMLVDALELVVDLERSHGSWIHDARSGREILDMTSFFASNAVGINHPAMMEPGFMAEIGRAAINKVTNSDFYTREMAETVQVFGEVGIPSYLPFLFFIEGGTLAVENALKTAFDWKHRKNLAAGRTIDENRLAILHFKHAFHGRSGYTLSMTNTHDPRKYMYFPRFDWPRVDPPYLHFPVDAAETARVAAAEQATLDQIRAAAAQRPHEIAGLIIEGIMGEGGDRHFRTEFFQALRRLCDELEIFFIIDEVQSGMGMTGAFWAHQHRGIKPDVIAFGKKAQVCGILAGPRVDEVERNVFREPSRINSTWGGNLVDMIRFRRILEIMRDENLVENARIMGDRLLAGLRDIEARHDQVRDTRGQGLMCALDVDLAQRPAIKKRCYERGMLVLPCGECSIRIRPHLAVTADEIDRCLEILDGALAG